jgi:hypothetical protein
VDLRIAPTLNGAWGIFGQALLRAKGLSSGSEAIGWTLAGELDGTMA